MKRKFILLPITLTALAPAISLVGCGDPDTPEPPGPVVDITKELDQDKSTKAAMTETGPFNIELNKIYRFNVNASICPSESFLYATERMTFCVYKENSQPRELKDVSIVRVKVGRTIFQEAQSKQYMEQGEYFYNKDYTLWLRNYAKPDPTFTMSIDLQFKDNEGESVIARWYSSY